MAATADAGGADRAGASPAAAMTATTPRHKLDLAALAAKKREGAKIAMLTCYDFPTARLLDAAGVDVLLVGDSAANVVLGHRDTVPVGMEEMLMLTRAVSRGASHALVMGDMPFGSYNACVEDAIRNGTRFLKESLADFVKVEGGGAMAATVAAMTRAGIPTVGHLGLTPQTASMLGGYRVQGRTAEAAGRLLDDARRLQDAGACLLVLECVPAPVAGVVAKLLDIPVIGIGAGAEVDGQVLVLHDALGIQAGFSPKFVRRFAELGREIEAAARAYVEAVRDVSFPAAEHAFKMDPQEWEKFPGRPFES